MVFVLSGFAIPRGDRVDVRALALDFVGRIGVRHRGRVQVFIESLRTLNAGPEGRCGGAMTSENGSGFERHLKRVSNGATWFNL